MKSKCPECGLEYRPRYINRHLVQSHGYKYYDGVTATKFDPTPEVSEPSDERWSVRNPATCKICGTTFDTQSRLQNHITDHHSASSDSLALALGYHPNINAKDLATSLAELPNQVRKWLVVLLRDIEVGNYGSRGVARRPAEQGGAK